MGVDESERVHAANLEKVDHVVVVMLENRSFDHMLGYLSLTGGRPDIDGLRPGLANEYQGRAYPVHHLGTTALDLDPDHCADAVDEQIAGGSMGGFVANAAATLAGRGIQASWPRLVSWPGAGTHRTRRRRACAGLRSAQGCRNASNHRPPAGLTFSWSALTATSATWKGPSK